MTETQRAVLLAARASTEDRWLPPARLASAASGCEILGWLDCQGEEWIRTPSGRRRRRWVYRISAKGLAVLASPPEVPDLLTVFATWLAGQTVELWDFVGSEASHEQERLQGRDCPTAEEHRLLEALTVVLDVLKPAWGDEGEDG